ncbi:unnamed protein product [Leuciscus chuanchicus]
MGPIFDHDHDGLRDTEEMIKEHAVGSVSIPTHFYSLIISCEELNDTLDECDGGLRVTSFILPHREDNSESCNWYVFWGRDRLCRVRVKTESLKEQVRVESEKAEIGLETGLEYYITTGYTTHT